MSARSRQPALKERREVAAREPRADAFARLFEAVHEGVYIGTLGPGSTATIAANPHLKGMFGFAA